MPIGDRAVTKKELEALAQRIDSRIVALRVRTTGRVSNLVELFDTPTSYQDQAGKFLLVHADEDRVYFEEAGITDLWDTPSSLSGESLKGLRVNVGETAFEFATMATNFLSLDDTPSVYTAEANSVLKVNATPDGIVFGANIEDLDDVPAITGEGLKLLRVNSGGTAVEWVDMDAFIDLADTPSAYTSQDDRYVKVNSTPDGLEFGRRIFVSDSAPTTEGDDGDIWIEY